MLNVLSKTAQRTLQITIAFLICTGVGWGQDWGGTSLRTASTSMDVTYLNSASVGTAYGAFTATSMKATTAPTVERAILIRMASDPHTSGYTQDSAKIYIYWASGDPDNAADSLTIYGYVLRRGWGEGNNVAATADSCEATWDSAYSVGSGCTAAAWATGGAQNTSSDRQATVACSLLVPGIPSVGYMTFTVAGAHLTQDFFDYGMILQIGRADATFETMTFRSDDYVTEAQRPYIEGWETAPAAGGSLPIGTTKLGTVQLAPPQ